MQGCKDAKCKDARRKLTAVVASRLLRWSRAGRELARGNLYISMYYPSRKRFRKTCATHSLVAYILYIANDVSICAGRSFFCGDFRIVFRGWDAHRLHELGQDRSRVGRDDRCVYICVERSFWLCVFGIVFRGWDAHTHCKVLTSTSLPNGITRMFTGRNREPTLVRPY